MLIKKIKLNFLPSYVMFYDWLSSDDIKEYQNIPVYRVKSNIINDFINYKLQLLDDDYNKLNKIIIISDSYSSLAVMFDESGYNVLKSSTLLDDEIRINDIIKDLKLTNIKYLKKQIEKNDEELRIVMQIKDTINNELVKIKMEADYVKLSYFYYELFNKKCNNYPLMLKQIQERINKDLTDKEIYLYNMIQKCYKLV